MLFLCIKNFDNFAINPYYGTTYRAYMERITIFYVLPHNIISLTKKKKKNAIENRIIMSCRVRVYVNFGWIRVFSSCNDDE